MKITDAFYIKHSIEGEYNREEISAEELHHFACEVLVDLYSQNGCTITVAQITSDPFNKVFVVQGAGICYAVRAKLSNQENTRLDDFSFIHDFAKKYNFIPRLVTAIFYDYNGCGVWAYKGSEYALRYEVDSLFEVNEPIIKANISEKHMLHAFYQAWNKLDTSIIEKYLHPKLKYSSDWVFDILPSKVEFVHYLKGKFETLKKRGVIPDVELVEINNKLWLKFNQNNELAFLDVKISEGYIIEACLKNNHT